jgi:hypothetical protein
MIAPALTLLALAASSADPCAPLTPRAPDPAAAAHYRSIALAERDRGAPSTAAVAFRSAAERDPLDVGSRAELARLCQESKEDPFASGVALLDAGDPRGALRAFHAARGAGPRTPALALMEGICLVELGEDDRAEPLLRLAEATPAQRDVARLFLGVVRLRAGDAPGAAALFAAARESRGLAPAAEALGRLARRDGRLVLSLLVESGWDSNVTLAPSSDPSAAEGDGFGGVSGAVLWRPLGPSGPFARGDAGLSRQVTQSAYDLAAFDVGGGLQLRRRSLALVGEYAFGTRTLAGAPYLSTHRLLASAVLGTRTTLATAYSARFERYAGDYRSYSGVLHRAGARLGFPLGAAARLDLGYGGARDLADAAELAYLEHGPGVELRVALRPRLRLALDASVAFRRYDEADPALGTTRADTVAQAVAAAELDLGKHLVGRLSVRGEVARSNVDAFSYGKVVPVLGILWIDGF